MASIPLVANTIRPIEQPDALQNFARIQQLRQNQQQMQQQAAMAPLQLQQAQQQIQAGQLQNQVAQQDLQDSQNFRAAMQDPAMRGKTVGQVADALAAQGKISQKAWAAAKEADLKARADAQKLTDDQATALQSAYKSTQPIYDNVMKMDDAALQQNWPQIAQQYDAIWNPIRATHPNGAQFPVLDPNQPMTKAQLAQFGPMLQLGQAYTDEDTKRRAAAADAALKETNAKRGGSTDLDKFEYDFLQSNKLPDTPENRQKAFDEYTRKTKIVPAQVRVEGYAQSRELPVIDTKNNNALQYVSAADINASNKVEPGRYIPASQGTTALNKTSLIEDIRGNVNQVRANLQDKNMPEFTADQRAALAIALGGSDARQGVLDAMARGGVLGKLTPEQQDFVINLAQLKENAMAMRSVLGAGQGSEDLRNAIIATLPGPRNPSKAYGLNQLQKFENTLNRLSRGVPNVPLRGGPNGAAPAANAGDDPLGLFK